MSTDTTQQSTLDYVKKIGRKCGKEISVTALKLYYAVRDPSVPFWAKTAAVGALAYFGLPADATPDVLPVVGFTDDLSVMVAALGTISAHITDEIREKAETKFEDLFG